jgi:hypothetical protein
MQYIYLVCKTRKKVGMVAATKRTFDFAYKTSNDAYRLGWVWFLVILKVKWRCLEMVERDCVCVYSTCSSIWV